ncbi:MAG: hypothetical protein A3F78_10260 [Burkholderiales bacterium RIFCSPLOWO2_12_FULL_61_40]|nr:MAG: hypothetical protein A3F78_10260 [Burkholderiales bacterium RIFCSPLOWO2_12_FULL_61_40]
MTDLENRPTLYADILRHAQERPLAIAAIDGPRAISYVQFAKDIEAVSRRLYSLHLPDTGLVAISVQEPYLHWLVLIGLWRNGLASVSVDRVTIASQLAYFEAPVLIMDHDLSAPFDGQSIRMDGDWLVENGESLPHFQEKMLLDDQPLRLAVSSGTTGTPKRSVFTKRVVDARLERVRRNPRFNTSICFMSLVGVASVEFFFSVGAWSVGGTVEFCKQPVRDALTLGELKANLLFMNTAQLKELVHVLPADQKPNKSLIVLVGGSIVPKEICEKALQRLAGSLMIIYGSTETGTVAINPNPLEYAEPGVCGFVVPNMEVQAINDAGHPVGDSVVGEIRIRSTSCISAYVNEPESTSASFKDGWFYPGDLGKLGKNGLMTIVGRVDEIMNIGGWKVAPALIEDILFKCAGVRDMAACAVPDADGMEQLWAVVVKGEGYVQEQLVALWKDSGAPQGTALNIAYCDAIPRNAMGKTLRAELVDLIKRNRPQEAAPIKPAGTAEVKNQGAMVRIRDQDFAIDKLSAPAQAQVASLQFVDAELQRLGSQMAVYQTAHRLRE